jgi:cytoskeleton protein RodZ
MTEQIEMPDEFVAPKGPGEQLRLAREKLGLSVAQIAERTRIQRRQIDAIEAGDFGALPGRAYAVGFARTMARETGLDEEAIVTAVRAELDRLSPEHNTPRETYDPSDPSRVPSGKLVWFSAVAGIVLLAGLFMAARVLFSPAAQLPSLVQEQQAAEAAAAAASNAAPDPMGQVTLTALGPVWVRITSGDGLRMMEGELDHCRTARSAQDHHWRA